MTLEDVLRKIIGKLSQKREDEVRSLRDLTICLLYECGEMTRSDVMETFAQKYQGVVRGAYIKDGAMHLVIKDQKRPCESVALGLIPDEYKDQKPFSVILPSI